MATTSARRDTPPLLEVTDLTKDFPSGGRTKTEHKRAVDGVSFEIAPGQSFGLVGESGSGKSTIARLVTGLARPTAGRIAFRGEPLPQGQRGLKQVRREIQMIFQDPRASLNPRMTVHQLIVEPLVLHKVGNRNTRHRRVRELLDEVGLPATAAAKLPVEFSGGQRQRIMIARALALNPSLLVADECVSALDVSVQAQVLNLLLDLKSEHNLAFLFISHNLAVVEFMADVIGVLYQGAMLEICDAKNFRREARSTYAQQLISAIPDIDAGVRA